MKEKTNYKGTLLALDVASRVTGYAIFRDGTKIASDIWRLKKIGDLHDFGGLTEKLTATVKKYGITEIVAEDIFRDKDKKLQDAFYILAQCQAITISVSQLNKLPISFISPLAVKAHMNCLRGVYHKLTEKEKQERRAKEKAAMIKEVQRLGYILNSGKDDEADAIGVGITHLELLGHWAHHPQSQK
jgi:Holliday junction resolvasome RuvABC endonuclease subunit